MVAASVATAVVLLAGYAYAVGSQQQGNVQKLYVTSAPDFFTGSTAWTPVPGLLISGTGSLGNCSSRTWTATPRATPSAGCRALAASSSA
jgi:hypothetical protein